MRNSAWPPQHEVPERRQPAARTITEPTDKPIWVDALEESLLIAIGVFSLVTWVVIRASAAGG
jgi:hypothetical protein